MCYRQFLTTILGCGLVPLLAFVSHAHIEISDISAIQPFDIDIENIPKGLSKRAIEIIFKFYKD